MFEKHVLSSLELHVIELCWSVLEGHNWVHKHVIDAQSCEYHEEPPSKPAYQPCEVDGKGDLYGNVSSFLSIKELTCCDESG